VRPDDLASAASRERFLATLPEWLFGTVGGNTPCVECRLDDGTMIVFDGGSGIEELARAMQNALEPVKEYHIFFTHFHYDHIQGLPFFAPAYDPKVNVYFYSPVENFEDVIRNQMQAPYFPITMEGKMSRNLRFTVLREQPVRLGNAEITWRPLNHPNGAYGYKVVENGKRFVHATDVELLETDFQKTEENARFFENADMLILDTQYTLGEAIEKYNWGHSSFSLGVDFATVWNARKLFLFHHEPLYDDKKLYSNLQAARWYANRLGNTEMEIYLSEEGEEVQL
jgi:phosphoribosyl 1,2-cyclic phosphodiesterase